MNLSEGKVPDDSEMLLRLEKALGESRGLRVRLALLELRMAYPVLSVTGADAESIPASEPAVEHVGMRVR